MMAPTSLNHHLSSTASRCRRILLLVLTCLAGFPQWLQAATVSSSVDDNDHAVDDPTCDARTGVEDDRDVVAEAVPSDCRMVMAPSAIAADNAGWGIFALHEMRRGQRVLFGDVVIQLSDLQSTKSIDNIDSGMRLALHEYLWSAEETGGFYEGINVTSVVPGVGMLANGMGGGRHNVLPAVPRIDEGGLTRLESPGAGAISHYHNQSFYIQRPIEAGYEILVHYGDSWFQERSHQLLDDDAVAKQDVDWLRKNGICLDNVKPGRSAIPNAGRGVFATRDLPSGSIVAPVPVLPLRRRTLQVQRRRDDDNIVQTHQLLLNYCLGHNKSSILLYPYGPFANLVNHHDTLANVRLEWSTDPTFLGRSGPTWFTDLTPDEVFSKVLLPNRTGLLLQLVALRPLHRGEEIVLDYGQEWAGAWRAHAATWRPTAGANAYAPSYVMDDVIKVLRTEQELKVHPYPDNIFTSCFYRYTDNSKELEQQQSEENDSVVAFRWKMTRGLFEPRHLRPCSILQRNDETTQAGPPTFTVRMRNRYGLDPRERIPKGTMHIVTHVPRHAVQFSDKILTTDQHLSNAFRHEIGISDAIFPDAWKDLATVAPENTQDRENGER